MCCNEYRNSLHEYAGGGLSELEQHAVARHLKSCENCRRELNEIKALKVFLKSDFSEVITPPMNLKSGIMASIDLKKYKKVYKNTLGELANWGMSLVAAGLIILLINTAPIDDKITAQQEWDNTRENIAQKLHRPFSSLNEGLYKFTDSITRLDGITGRLEKDKKGGSNDEL